MRLKLVALQFARSLPVPIFLMIINVAEMHRHGSRCCIRDECMHRHYDWTVEKYNKWFLIHLPARVCVWAGLGRGIERRHSMPHHTCSKAVHAGDINLPAWATWPRCVAVVVVIQVQGERDAVFCAGWGSVIAFWWFNLNIPLLIDTSLKVVGAWGSPRRLKA